MDYSTPKQLSQYVDEAYCFAREPECQEKMANNFILPILSLYAK